MSTTTTINTELETLDKNGNLMHDPVAPASDQSRSQELLVEATAESDSNELSKGRSAAIIVTIAGINFLNTLGSGTLTVALPAIAKDLDLSRELLLW